MKKIIALLVSLSLGSFSIGQKSYADGKTIVVAAGAAIMISRMGAVANGATGKGYMAKCKAQPVFCAMAVLAFAQAAGLLSESSKDAKTQDAAKCIGANCDGGTIDPTTGLPIAMGDLSPTELGSLQDQVDQAIAKLEDKGYKYNASTGMVNTPNGDVSPAALANDEALADMGMSEQDIADARKIAKDALKDLAKYAGDLDSGGGGGRKINPGPGYDSGKKAFDMSAYLASLSNKRGVAGLEKKYGSDQIGVAQDNLFEMVHRRYDAKKTGMTP